MRILVTGSQGYLGGAVVPTLVLAGHDVVGLDSGWFADCTFFEPPREKELLQVDLRDVRPEHLQDFDAVVHLAALSNDPLGDLDPDLTHELNHRQSVRLAELARDAGVQRFIYSSTCSVYGATGSDILVNEDAPLRPVTPYAVSKVRAEEDIHALAGSAFTTVALRNATVYGLAARLRADLVVHDLAVAAVHTGTAVVRSDGTPWRPLVHVQDVAEAFLAVLSADDNVVTGASFNTGRQGENHRVAEIARVVAEAAGAKVEITGETGADPRSYRVDFSRLRRAVPSFEPSWTLERGAREVVAAVRSSPLLPGDYRDRFVRLRQLAALQRAGRLGADLRWLS